MLGHRLFLPQKCPESIKVPTIVASDTTGGHDTLLTAQDPRLHRQHEDRSRTAAACFGRWPGTGTR
jgi:hypothetical protein